MGHTNQPGDTGSLCAKTDRVPRCRANEGVDLRRQSLQTNQLPRWKYQRLDGQFASHDSNLWQLDGSRRYTDQRKTAHPQAHPQRFECDAPGPCQRGQGLPVASQKNANSPNQTGRQEHHHPSTTAEEVTLAIHRTTGAAGRGCTPG